MPKLFFGIMFSMGNNSFGKLFTITTWGESHGPSVGVVIDGCPAGLFITVEDIQATLVLRSCGRAYTSARKEPDMVEILSGVFEGQTTGAPISLLIRNLDTRSEDYLDQKNIIKPGHAQFTYLEKYGIFDYFGNGRASARETVCRVAAGAIAKKILDVSGIKVVAFLHSCGNVSLTEDFSILDTDSLDVLRRKSPILCPEEAVSNLMLQEIQKALEEKDSVGGIVEAIVYPVPSGLGDPVYDKLSANLGKALFSIPAVTGVEIGDGFLSSRKKGSEQNDSPYLKDGKVGFLSNHAGGIVGGISNGEPIRVKVSFKPTSSIGKLQKTVTIDKKDIHHSFIGRHDPCVAIRAVAVVEAMIQLTLVDALLLQRCSRL
jgi:chorismate synthase